MRELKRSYRPAYSHEGAIELLVGMRGQVVDPELLSLLLAEVAPRIAPRERASAETHDVHHLSEVRPRAARAARRVRVGGTAGVA